MILFIVYAILSASGIILFKLGSTGISLEITKSVFGFQMSYYSLIGLLCYIVSFILWMVIISKNDVSYIVPIGLAVTNLLILIGSYAILGEQLSLMKIVGVGVILLGIALLNL